MLLFDDFNTMFALFSAFMYLVIVLVVEITLELFVLTSKWLAPFVTFIVLL